MRVIHIIPSAFDYFDDIRSQAFKLLDGLHKLGVENEAFTLQYGSTTKSMKSGVAKDSPAVHSYVGNFNIEKAIAAFSDFDIVHLHCPFLGAGGKILSWKQTHPDTPLVVSYYRDMSFTDMISALARFYNAYYLPRIFNLAEAVICLSGEKFLKSAGYGYVKNKEKIFDLSQLPDGEVAQKVEWLYNNI